MKKLNDTYLDSLLNKILNETIQERADELASELTGEDKESKKGKKFPDLTGDGDVTFADILKGRGVELDEENMCEQCGEMMSEGVCEQCDNSQMEEETDEGIYDVAGKFPKHQEFDYVQEEDEMMGDDESSDPLGYTDRYCDESSDEYNSERCSYFQNNFSGAEMTEKLHGKQRNLDHNKNGKIDAEDLRMARGKKSITMTESEMINLIEKIIKEEKLKATAKHKGLATYEKAHKGSGKENNDYLKDVTKKMKDYLKDGSKGEYSMEPKIFPKGNGELAKMSKKAYIPDNAAEEYTDNFTAAGLENLVYDEIHPNEEWVDSNIEGSSKTGNNPEWGNAVETGVNKKRNKIRKDNLLGAVKQMAYNKAPQPTVDDTKKGAQGKFEKNFGKDAGKKATKILNQLESVEEKESKKINEEFERMKNLISYSQKTQ